MEKYIDPRNISIFVEVCRHSSFSKAAHTLGLPNSHVSRRVRELEARLGVKLINRSTRSFELSDVGRIYAAKCGEALNRISSANDYVESLNGVPQGRLEIVTPYELGTHLSENFLAKFLQIYQGISVDLVFKNRAELKDFAKADVVLEIGVTFGPQKFVQRKVAQLNRYLYASPQYLRNGTIKHPKQIPPEHLIGFLSDRGEISATNTVFFNSKSKEEFTVDSASRVRLSSLTAMKNLAVAGLGIAAVAPFVVETELARGQLVQILPEWSSRPVPIFAVFDPTRSLSPKIKVFVDGLSSHFARTP